LFPCSTDIETENGNTITHAECAYFSKLRQYPKKKKTVKSRNKNGWTPLFASYYHENIDAEYPLILNNVNYNDIDYFGNNPCFYIKKI
jgi:hypothetical protein